MQSGSKRHEKLQSPKGEPAYNIYAWCSATETRFQLSSRSRFLSFGMQAFLSRNDRAREGGSACKRMAPAAAAPVALIQCRWRQVIVLSVHRLLMAQLSVQEANSFDYVIFYQWMFSFSIQLILIAWIVLESTKKMKFKSREEMLRSRAVDEWIIHTWYQTIYQLSESAKFN